LLLQPEVFHCRNCTKDILKYSSPVNIGGILNITFVPQNTITTYEKAEIVSQYSSTQLDDGEHTASLTPHYNSILLLNILPLRWNLCNLVIWIRVLKHPKNHKLIGKQTILDSWFLLLHDYSFLIICNIIIVGVTVLFGKLCVWGSHFKKKT
jgi:hypothetical protein